MPDRAIDVVVPVYNAAADLKRCVESVLAHTAGAHRLVLIDDASPDPAIAAYFGDLERRALPDVVLLRNEQNLGFIGTANRAFALSHADVVLLNSDTVVTAGWLDALARCAESDATIGTVTPFSNNAEICSFPRFCEDNPWPEGVDPELTRSALAHSAVPSYPDLPTGVGFCLYVRRALIDAVGVFDTMFGRGYGEENDLCMRATAAGYRNVLCDDAFVLHLGGRSFEGEKATLGQRNLELLFARHPTYLDLVRDYIACDPLRAIREAALACQRVMTEPSTGVLHVVHRRGGVGDACAQGCVERSAGYGRHYVAYADGDAWRIEESLPGGGTRAFAFRRGDGERWAEFLGALCATFAIERIQVHDGSGCREGVGAASTALGRHDPGSGDNECACTGEGVGALDVVPSARTPFAPVRIRDALGYVAWRPPAIRETSPAVPEMLPRAENAKMYAEAAVCEPSPLVGDPVPDAVISAAPDRDAPTKGRLLRAVSRFGQTLPGRTLRRLTPGRMRAALKARLR